jgi:hypothetical protein
MDGWINGWIDGWMDRRMKVGRSDRRINGPTESVTEQLIDQ